MSVKLGIAETNLTDDLKGNEEEWKLLSIDYSQRSDVTAQSDQNEDIQMKWIFALQAAHDNKNDYAMRTDGKLN